METPSSNPAAYKFGSLLNFVDQVVIDWLID